MFGLDMDGSENVLKDCLFLTQEEISAETLVRGRVKNIFEHSPDSSRFTDRQLKLSRENLSTGIHSCGENRPERGDQSDVTKNHRQCIIQRQSFNIFCTSNFDKLKKKSFPNDKSEQPPTTTLKTGDQKSFFEPKSKGNKEPEDDTQIRVLKSGSNDGVDFLNGNPIGLKSILEVQTEVKNSPVSLCERKTTINTSLEDYQTAITVGREKRDADMPEPKTEETCDDEEVNLDLEEPSDEVMEYARRELGETEEVKCVTLQEFRDMIYERGECTPHRMDDAFLIRFLRARKFNVNSAHRLVVNYCNFKEDHPDIHRDVNPFDMRFIGDDDIINVPANRTQCGRRMMIYRIGNWDPRKYSVVEIFKATVIVLELGILEPVAQVMGGIVIFDFEGLTMAHAWSITPQIAGMVMSLLVSAFPIRSHAIHILHQSWVFDAIFSVFKPLLDSRMRDKLFFHGDNMESLHRHISPESLPKKYGGIQNELPYYKWIDALSKNREIVNEMVKLGYIAPEEILNGLKQ